MNEVTRILNEIESGDSSKSDLLLPLVYDELKALASARLKREKDEHLLQTTALVHEAYTRLVDVEKATNWHSRGHFFGAVAEAMRRILVEEARKRNSLKRGRALRRVSGVSQLEGPNTNGDADRVLAVNEALDRYAEVSVRGTQVVKLRFFAGMTNEEIADALSISIPTVKRDWATAKVWIFRYLRDNTDD